MKFNRQILQALYDKYNKLYFDSQLPPLSSDKVGLYVIMRTTQKKPIVRKFFLSSVHNAGEEVFRYKLLHEMIHVYLALKNGIVRQTHGRDFLFMCEELEYKYGLSVGVSHRPSGSTTSFKRWEGHNMLEKAASYFFLPLGWFSYKVLG